MTAEFPRHLLGYASTTQITNRAAAQVVEQKARNTSGSHARIVPIFPHHVMLEWLLPTVDEDVRFIWPLFIVFSLSTPHGVQHFALEYRQRAAVAALRFARPQRDNRRITAQVDIRTIPA